jgi:tRNA pseudouridine55 synthase
MKRDDIVLIDKEPSWTSFDVVAKIRGMIRAKYQEQGVTPTKRQLKVGHTGTLDPFATGLVIILLGDACSESDSFLKLDKVYEATIKLGETSTTGDPEGEITPISNLEPTTPDIDTTLKQFVGTITQVPPMHSAIKINGQRAYKLARAGQTVEMPSRTVTVYSISLLDYTYPYVKIQAHVSSGTYIRTLAEDIGRALGTGAYCTALRRTKVGDYDLSDAKTIAELNIDK